TLFRSGQGPGVGGGPRLGVHRYPAGLEPGDVRQLGQVVGSGGGAVEETTPPQHRMVGTEGDQLPGEGQQWLVQVLPVDPGQLVVLGVDVVVALLGAAHLVPVGEHRHPLGDHQRGEEVALLASAQAQDVLVVGGAFGAAVPGPVVALPVPVVLTVGLVVLLVVGDQVGEGEPVVGGDEVDRGDRGASGAFVQVGGSGQPAGELAEGGGLTAPEVAHGVPVLAVPLGPQRREPAHLVAPAAQVPW